MPCSYPTKWLVGCFGFNGPLRQYFSLYRAVSQRGRKRREKIDESKNVQTTPTRTYCKRSTPLPYCIQIVGRPGTGSLPSTIAPPDHPQWGWLGDAMVLGKLSVPGRPSDLVDSRARAYCACSGCGWGFFFFFLTFLLSSIFALLFLPLFGRRPDID